MYIKYAQNLQFFTLKLAYKFKQFLRKSEKSLLIFNYFLKITDER